LLDASGQDDPRDSVAFQIPKPRFNRARMSRRCSPLGWRGIYFMVVYSFCRNSGTSPFSSLQAEAERSSKIGDRAPQIALPMAPILLW